MGKHLIALGIVVAVIAAIAIGIVWASGGLGPVTIEPLTPAEAMQRCEDAVTDPSGRLTDPEFTEMSAARSTTGWRITGTMTATNVHGARLARGFECLVEANRDTWGVSSSWTSNAEVAN